MHSVATDHEPASRPRPPRSSPPATSFAATARATPRSTRSRGVSVDIERGRLTAVMGPSGSGKSTLMHILAGLDTPTSGEVTVAGVDIAGLDDTALTQLRRDHIGFIFQFFNLLPMLTAAENIALPLKLAGGKPDAEWLEELVDKVGLGERLGHRPSELSGGQQQRVAVARALVSRPSVMFADEPTGNLDSTTSGEILALLRDSVDTLGQTTVMVTHDAHAAAIADRVLFLADGNIVHDLGRSHRARDPRDARGGERTMIGVALKGLAGRKIRALLTASPSSSASRWSAARSSSPTRCRSPSTACSPRPTAEHRRRHQRQGDRQGLHQRQRRHHPRSRCSRRSGRCPRSAPRAATVSPPRPTSPTSSAATARRPRGRASAAASTPPTRGSAR